MDTESVEYKKTNRQKKMSPKTGTLTWCNQCDRDMVHDGEKCGTCNSIQGPRHRRLKKETSARN